MIVLVHLRRLEKHLMQLWEMQLLIRKRKMLKRQDQPNLIKLVYLYPRNVNKYLYIIILIQILVKKNAVTSMLVTDVGDRFNTLKKSPT